MLASLGVPTSIEGILDSAFAGFNSVFPLEEAIFNPGVHIHALNVVVQQDQLEEDLRLLVERNLAHEAKLNPVGTFQLPAQFGGRLELAREIVAETIAAMTAAGLNVNEAPLYLAAGDQKYATGKYRKAFDLYRQAYEEAAK